MSGAISAAARAAPSRLDRPVVDRAVDLLGDRRGDHLRAGTRRSPCSARAVALEPVPDVAVLLEVVAQREVQERPAGRGQLHRRRQAALDDRQVARREVPVQIRDEGPHLDAGRRAEDAGSMRGPATAIIRSPLTRRAASG